MLLPPLAVVGGGVFLFRVRQNPLSRLGLLGGIVREMDWRGAMKKYLDWIVAHKVKASFITFGLFIVPIIVIHFLYKWITPYYLLQSSWSSGELITYIAGFEAFVGTVFLGVVAARQNEKANELSERVLKLEEDSYFFSRFPNIVIVGDHVEKGSFREHINKTMLIYINEKNFDIRNEFAVEKDQPYFLIRFIVRNLSGFNVRVKLYKLFFEGFETEDISYLYQSSPINFKPEKAVIAPSNELKIGFLVKDIPLVNSLKFTGVMHLFISNNLNEEFHYTTKFMGLIDIDAPALFVLDQYDSKLNGGSSSLI